MSRPIKFRAWDGSRWVYYTLHQLIQGEAYEMMAPALREQFSLKHWSQFTGLLDKNGKEIFEGDVWKGEPIDSDYGEKITGVVDYDAPKFGVRIWAGSVRVWFNSGEVIGNIYEHGELLK